MILLCKTEKVHWLPCRFLQKPSRENRAKPSDPRTILRVSLSQPPSSFRDKLERLIVHTHQKLFLLFKSYFPVTCATFSDIYRWAHIWRAPLDATANQFWCPPPPKSPMPSASPEVGHERGAFTSCGVLCRRVSHTNELIGFDVQENTEETSRCAAIHWSFSTVGVKSSLNCTGSPGWWVPWRIISISVDSR